MGSYPCFHRVSYKLCGPSPNPLRKSLSMSAKRNYASVIFYSINTKPRRKSSGKWALPGYACDYKQASISHLWHKPTSYVKRNVPMRATCASLLSVLPAKLWHSIGAWTYTGYGTFKGHNQILHNKQPAHTSAMHDNVTTLFHLNSMGQTKKSDKIRLRNGVCS